MELGKLTRGAALRGFWRGALIRMVMLVFWPWLAVVALSDPSYPTILLGVFAAMASMIIARAITQA